MKGSKQQSKQFDLESFKFLYDWVLVRPIKNEAAGGLVRPDQYDDKPEYGTVVGVGTGRLMENGSVVKPDIKVGSTVLFGKYSSIAIRSQGEDFLLIRLEDIIAYC